VRILKTDPDDRSEESNNDYPTSATQRGSDSEGDYLTHHIHLFSACKLLEADGYFIDIAHREMGPVKCYKNGFLEATFEKPIYFIDWINKRYRISSTDENR
jgi:hypothetical protein